MYLTRAANSGRFAVGLAIILMFVPLIPTGTAFALQNLWLRPSLNTSQIAIRFDPSRVQPSETTFNSSDSDRRHVIVSLPLSIHGLPESSELKCEGGEVRLGKATAGFVHDCIYRDGEQGFRLNIYLDHTVFKQIASTPVELRVSTFLNVIRRREVARISARQQTFQVPGLGVCSHMHFDQPRIELDDRVGFECVTPLRRPLAYEYEIRRNGRQEYSGRVNGADSILPNVPVAGLVPLEDWWLLFNASNVSASGERLNFPQWFWKHPDSELVFTNPEVLAHFRRDIYAKRVRLLDYLWRANS